jgi:hypothetical protein
MVARKRLPRFWKVPVCARLHADPSSDRQPGKRFNPVWAAGLESEEDCVAFDLVGVWGCGGSWGVREMLLSATRRIFGQSVGE